MQLIIGRCKGRAGKPHNATRKGVGHSRLSRFLLCLFIASPVFAQHTVALTWTASTTPGTTIDIFRAPGTAPATGYVQIATGVAAGGPFTDASPMSGAQSYYVAANLAGAESAPSNEISVSLPPAANTWFVRADGGTRQQCTGLSDTAYPGSGTGQSCAFNDFRYMWSPNDGTGTVGTWLMAGGDTVVIRGCHALGSQQNPANPTCRLGYDNDNNGNPPNSWCPSIGNNDCHNPDIPAGTSGQHTRILGGCMLAGNCNTGNVTNRGNLTQLFGGFGLRFSFNLQNTSYVDIEGIELTTHNGACSHQGSPAFPTGCSTSVPYGDYADNGFLTNNATSNITFQDVYTDGFESNGFFGPIGGPITMTRVFSGFNIQAGWQFDDGSSTPDAAGSQIIASYVTMNGNGCKQQYPIVNTSWPALACWDDIHSGFGDAWSGQNTALDVFTCDHCVMLYNTKDAFIGPHTQIKNLTITNSFSAGNMGAQWKWGAALSSTILFQNNLTVMNCNRQRETLPGAAQNFNISTGLPGSYLSDYCRAGGDGFSSPTRATSTNQVFGSTFIGANSTMFDFGCGFVDGGGAHAETTCGTSPWIFKDNNILGYTDPVVGAQPGLWFFDPTFGGASIVLTADHNNYFGVRNITPDVCGTNNITCVSPLLTSQPAQTWPGSEAALDVFNAFAGSGNSFFPTGSSPLLGTGTTIAGMTTDFYGTTRPSPPAMSGAQLAGTPTVATPTASPVAGTYTSTQSVTLSTVTAGATICYTTNGTTPAATTPGTCDGGSTTYSGAISVATTTTIKALGTLVANTNSGLFSGLYTITPPVTPVVQVTNVNISGSVTIP